MADHKAKHAAKQGETGTKTAGTQKTPDYTGQHRAGETARGTDAQNRPAGHDDH